MASIEQLESFVAVAQSGSIVAAAERLGKTHGPVSLAIQSLEDRWGELFVTGNGKRQLSKRGQALLPWAKAVVGGYYELKNSLGSGVITEVAVGIDSHLPNAWLEEVVAVLWDLDIRLSINTMPSDELISAFNQQRLDWIVTLADLPWPETRHFFAVGQVESQLFTSHEPSSKPAANQASTFDTGQLMTLPQLSLAHPGRDNAPIYKRFDFPCPWQVRVSDYSQVSAILNAIPSHTSAIAANIVDSPTITTRGEPHLTATWGVLVFWSEHLSGTPVLERLEHWAIDKSRQGRNNRDA